MKNDYADIVSRLRDAIRRHVLLGLAEALFSSLAVALLVLLVFGYAESVLYLPPAVKTPLRLMFFVAAGLVFGVVAFLRVIVLRPGIEEMARLAERRFTSLGDRLISAVQLGALRGGDLRGQSNELVDALITRVAKETAALRLTEAVPTRRLVFAGRCFAVLSMVFLLSVIVMPGRFANAVIRLVDHTGVYFAPGSVSIHVFRAPATIVRGDDFSLVGMLSGWNSEPLTFSYRWNDSRDWNSRTIDVDSRTGLFSAMVEKPRRSFVCYLESGSSGTRQFAVDVLERPDIETIAYTLSFPRYTGLPDANGRGSDGNIRALVGSTVAMTVTADKPLSRMTVVWSDSTTTECTLENDTGYCSFRVAKTIDYHIDIADTLGIATANPIMYRVTCLSDESPEAVIASPPPDIMLPLSMKIPLIYRARDDYGLSSVTLFFTASYDKKEQNVPLKKGNLGMQLDETYGWDLSGLNLLAEDTITYRLEVYDNDTVNGPKKGVSATGILRVPSMNDLYTEVMEEQEKGLDRLRDMSMRRLETDQLKEVEKSILNGEKLDWSDGNALEETKRSMESLQRDLKELSEDLKRSAERLSEEDLAAVETLEKYRTVSKLMDEIADGELKEAIKRMTQLNLQLDPRLLKDAIDKQKVDAEEIKKKLDRLIAMLEQVKTIQRFDIARRMVEEMAAKQAAVAGEYEKNPESEGLVREQEHLATEMESLEKELTGSMKALSDTFGMKTKGFEAFLDSLAVAETMKNAAVKMKSGKKSQASVEQKNANAGLSNLMSKLDEVANAMMNSNSEELSRRLFAALTDLLAVSGLQEDMIAFPAETPRAGSDSAVLAKRQLEVMDALNKSKRTLASFTELTADIAGIIDQLTLSVESSMKSAVDAYAIGDAPQGRSASISSLAGINRMAHILTLMAGGEAKGSQSMPGDLMRQLQQIANGQMSLQMQMQGEGGEQLMMQLAAEQQKLAEMLSELGKKIGDDPRLREMLEKLAEDMDDTSRMMRRNERRELVDRRQSDIYRRLLDARRSRREKDQEEERKSWTAKQNVSKGADSLAGDLGEKQREINRRIDQAMKDDFSPAYRQLIRRYFESMLKDYGAPAESAATEGGAK